MSCTTLVPVLSVSGTEVVDGDVRLAGNGSTSMVGRLEVYWNDEWGTVCGRKFGMAEAHVACRQLGLGYAASYSFNQRCKKFILIIVKVASYIPT